MNPNYTEFKCLSLARRWRPSRCAVACLSIHPATASPLEACANSFFDELREPNARCPMAVTCPHSSISALWLSIQPGLNSNLIPPHPVPGESSVGSVSGSGTSHSEGRMNTDRSQVTPGDGAGPIANTS
ncbi:hypothetical protein E2320_000702 [Naja naja]|nr:hypothetical protein E2320_000702 [Naja naja]